MSTKDMQHATADELRELARSLWWILDSIAMVDLCHRGNDTAFRVSMKAILGLREAFGVYSNDGKTLEYDPARHDKEVTTEKYFIVRPDGDLYPDDDVKRSEMIKQAMDARGIVGDCDCDSCRKCANAMWRVVDALSISQRELDDMKSSHGQVMANVMERCSEALHSLANPAMSPMAVASAELQAASTYLNGIMMTRTHKIAQDVETCVTGPRPGKGSKLSMIALTREQIASLPESMKEQIRKSFEGTGKSMPPELMTEEEKKGTFH